MTMHLSIKNFFEFFNVNECVWYGGRLLKICGILVTTASGGWCILVTTVSGGRFILAVTTRRQAVAEATSFCLRS